MFNVVTIYHSTLCVSSKKRNIGIIEPSLVRNITLLGVLKILLQKMYIQYTYFVYISSISRPTVRSVHVSISKR